MALIDTDPTVAPATEGRSAAATHGLAVASAVVPFVVALAVGAVVLWATGLQPWSVYALMAREAAGSTDRLAATLSSATPLVFTGLATAVAFRTGVFNVGVEGSFVAGGLAAAVVGSSAAGLPGPVLIVVAVVAGALSGAGVAFGPGLLRARWGVDEVVTTLMFNFVVTGVVAWLVNRFLLAAGVANSATALVAPHARLARLLPPSSVHLGLVIALVAVALYGWWMHSTSLGFELRLTGQNPRFAIAEGVRVSRVVLLAMLLSGVIGGLGGAAHALGTIGRFVPGFSPGYGYTGIAVALLGRNSAVGITLAALLFGALASAGAAVQLFSDIPLDIVNVLQGVVMIFAVAEFVHGARRRAVAT
jgi:general nucleoside transport system permease protein